MIWYLLHKCPLVLLQHYQTKMKKTNHFPSLHMHVNGNTSKKVMRQRQIWELRSMCMGALGSMPPILLVILTPDSLSSMGHYVYTYPNFLEKVKGLGISLIADPSTQVWWDSSAHGLTLGLPSKQQLIESVLQVSDERNREIERSTREQHRSPLWFDARRYRLTASLFEDVLQRSPDTPPDALVLRIIEPRQFVSLATEYGKNSESTALEEYRASRIHTNITICSAGFVIYKEMP